jgi:S-adenosylmethionine:tRNA ribosyltransferase-isomerase
MSASPAERCQLPEVRSARVPPEARGLARDGVRMAVVTPRATSHLIADQLPGQLRPGDVVVLNTSATLPAAVDFTRGGRPATLHFSTRLDDGSWVAEVRRADQRGPAVIEEAEPGEPGETLRLPGGVRLRLLAPYPSGQRRLWRAAATPAVDVAGYLSTWGRPIGYSYLDGSWPLESVQNTYAVQPGSAEMPSAGRPLTDRILVRLIGLGITITPIVLHTGVSSQEAAEPPQPEWFTVPEVTARLVNGASAAGRRIIAVGTTAARALESALAGGRVVPSAGWTSLVLGPQRTARVVTGLLTGLHEPQASHLALLEAVAGRSLVERAYRDITAPGAPGYLWHEFGDTMLLLP